MIACEGELFKAIEVTYGGIASDLQGSYPNFNGLFSISYTTLDDDEFISSTVTESDLIHRVNDLKIVTNKRTFGPCGPFPANGSRLLEHSGSRLLFIAGYSGTTVDTLVFHWN